jgi:predicted nucleic acid-binding protein
VTGPDITAELVLDSGALIALEKARPEITALLMRVRAGEVRMLVPDAVIAQVWRGGSGRQARVAALLSLKRDRCARLRLDTPTAKRIGVRIGMCGHTDITDVHVALAAEDHGAGVVTSDRQDILKVSPALRDVTMDV